MNKQNPLSRFTPSWSSQSVSSNHSSPPSSSSDATGTSHLRGENEANEPTARRTEEEQEAPPNNPVKCLSCFFLLHYGMNFFGSDLV